MDREEGKANAAIRKFLSEIGRKGGKANKGKAKEKCRLAAKARWEKYRAQKAASNS